MHENAAKFARLVARVNLEVLRLGMRKFTRSNNPKSGS
jgi:hypothetical protein